MRENAYHGEDRKTVKPPEAVEDAITALLDSGFETKHRTRVDSLGYKIMSGLHLLFRIMSKLGFRKTFRKAFGSNKVSDLLSSFCCGCFN